MLCDNAILHLTYILLPLTRCGPQCVASNMATKIDKIFENIPNMDGYKIGMDDTMVFSRRDQHFEDLTNFFKALIKFCLKFSPHKCQLLRPFDIPGSYIHVKRWQTITYTSKKKIQHSTH